MKCKIEITGQISGNYTLLRKLGMRSEGYIKGTFNSFYIIYNNIGDAKKDIKEAFQSLKSDEPDYYKEGGIYKQSDNSFLNYDASTAKIIY